ncbi:hypothetical protein MTO96_030408 [Rhipicephalus appendiculatus]
MVDVNRAVRVLGCNLLKGLFSRCGSGENLLVSPYAAMEKAFFRMANRVLVGSALALNDSYCKIGSRVYGTIVEESDFADDADSERSTVNEWAKQKAGITGDLLGAECTLAADTGIVLLSAASVKAVSWLQPVSSKVSPFGQVQAAPTLETCAVYGYAWLEELSLQAVDVPFSCEAFSATVLLPVGSKSLEELCESLTAELDVTFRVGSALKIKARYWSGCSPPCERFRRVVRVELPAISAETASDLKPVLVEMGVQQAFSDEAAFQRITPSSPSRVSWVLHRARLDMQANEVSSPDPSTPGPYEAGGVGP